MIDVRDRLAKWYKWLNGWAKEGIKRREKTVKQVGGFISDKQL